jgi:transposase InsO family protein
MAAASNRGTAGIARRAARRRATATPEKQFGGAADGPEGCGGPACATRSAAGRRQAGIRNRHDHGSQYLSDDYQAEIAFLGMESSPAFVRQPEGNGCVERFIRTLKEQLLWVRTFQNVEELRRALAEFRERYNQQWIVERLGDLTPAQARQQLLAEGAAA